MNGRTRAPRPPSEQFWLGLTKRWRDFGGRSRRYEFGSVVLLGTLSIGFVVAVGIGLFAASFSMGLFGVFLTAPVIGWQVIAVVAVTVRRLHDVDRPGWVVIALAVPLLGFTLLGLLLVVDGSAGSNRYGASPKYF